MPYAHLRRTLTVVAALCLLSTSGSAVQQSRPAATPGAVQNAAADEFVGALIAADSEGERERLLAASHELVTADLFKTLNARGERLRADGDYVRALASHRAALSVARKLDDAEGVAQSLSNLGGVYRSQGDYAKASESYDESVKRWEALGRPAGMARTLTSIGVLRYFQGEYDAALDAFHSGLKLLEGSGDKDTAAGALNGIGAVHRERGEYDLALEFYQRSLRVAEEQGNKIRSGTALNNIGILYKSWGDYARALEYYQRSYDLRAALGDKLGMSIAMLNIGDLHQLQGNYNLSLDYFQKSLVLREALGDKEGIATVLSALGEGYRIAGRYDLALESLRRSLSLREALGNKPRIARTLHNLGNVLLSQGDAAAARQFYERALALEEGAGDRERSVDTMNMLSLAYETQGASEKSLETASRAASLAREIGYLGGFWPARAVAGRAQRALKHTAEARAALDEAISTIETVRARAAGGEQEGQYFFADKISPYAEMVALLVGGGRNEEALTYAERAKGRVLLDVLRNGRTNIDKSLTPAERERESTFRRELSALNVQAQREASRARPDAARLAELNGRLDRARLDFDAYTNALYALHPELRLQRGDAPQASLTQLNEQLGRPDTALVEYVVGDEQTFLFVLTDVGRAAAPALKVYTLNVKRRELLDRVGRFHRQLAERDLLFGGAARALYDLLLAPARAQLQDKRALVIVPDDALWELPFQALQSSSGRYVLEDHAVSYTPSLSVARAVASRRRGVPAKQSPVPTLLAFGNPLLGGGAQAEPAEMMSAGTGALPDAERQVRTLGQLYGAANSRVYTGAEAREDRFKAEAGRYRILHLAAHGVLNNAGPMYSHIVLSRGTTDAAEDGLLETWELMNLDLNADMVVLSACETARGSVRPGEGMVGLSWGFFVAGSPTTLVSQWKVGSAATTELMLGFYRKLKGDTGAPKPHPATKATALREACLKLISSERYAHPFYWAGFVLIGDSH